MAIARDNPLKKLRDDTITTIVNLHLLQKITDEEMHFLLDLLDLVITGEGTGNLIPVLRTWLLQYNGSESDSIIKASLLGLNFSDQDSITRTSTIIKELLSDQFRA